MATGGIVAVGDSITAHCSEDLAVNGVPALSWAEWVSHALGLPLYVYAKPGAATDEILDLLPASFPETEIALVFAGVNNALSWKKWRKLDFETQLTQLVKRLSADSRQVFVLQVPERLGRTRTLYPYGPRMRRRVQVARAIVARVAATNDATLVDHPELAGDSVWIDGVHPTSVGHLTMADATLIAMGSPTLASDLSWTAAAPRADFKQWKRKSHIRFNVLQPIRGIGTWLFGR